MFRKWFSYGTIQLLLNNVFWYFSRVIAILQAQMFQWMVRTEFRDWRTVLTNDSILPFDSLILLWQVATPGSSCAVMQPHSHIKKMNNALSVRKVNNPLLHYCTGEICVRLSIWTMVLGLDPKVVWWRWVDEGWWLFATSDFPIKMAARKWAGHRSERWRCCMESETIWPHGWVIDWWETSWSQCNEVVPYCVKI